MIMKSQPSISNSESAAMLICWAAPYKPLHQSTPQSSPFPTGEDENNLRRNVLREITFWKYCKKTTSSGGCNTQLEIRKLALAGPLTFGEARAGESCRLPENSSPAPFLLVHFWAPQSCLSVMAAIFLEISSPMSHGGYDFFLTQLLW